ncbi:hypothetical protein SKAU_G00349000 [Synaphobranchus kaupii]|uniref:Uncharacterized protein n=1 Tax=Synaphobranchus kaupii TaxID=118154 RepID=A0A9Q1EK37_SYNKA|nr:hypothetical protein SKAU_G00349000 [Synaphobranchus kaupii]
MQARRQAVSCFSKRAFVFSRAGGSHRTLVGPPPLLSGGGSAVRHRDLPGFHPVPSEKARRRLRQPPGRANGRAGRTLFFSVAPL